MVLDATTTRVSRNGVLTLIAAVAVLFAMLSMFTPATARAAEPQGAGFAAAGWTPNLQLAGPKERVHRDVSSADRAYMLSHCAPQYVCVAAGQGDGMHTIYELYYCVERNLSNFIDAGTITNNQTGKATVWLLTQSRERYSWVEPGLQKDVDWRPIWFLQVC